MEHWLPLYYEHLETLFDYFDGWPMVFDHLALDAAGERLEQIRDHYQSRMRILEEFGATTEDGGTPYKPVPVEQLFLEQAALQNSLAGRGLITLSPFEVQDSVDRMTIRLDGRAGRNFAVERAARDINVFDALIDHVDVLRSRGKTPVIASWSKGARERMAHVLSEHGASNIRMIDGYGRRR